MDGMEKWRKKRCRETIRKDEENVLEGMDSRGVVEAGGVPRMD
jgi:hypothetical protein